MKVLNWALPQSNTFGIATLYPRPEGRGFTVELIKRGMLQTLFKHWLKNYNVYPLVRRDQWV